MALAKGTGHAVLDQSNALLMRGDLFQRSVGFTNTTPRKLLTGT